VADEVSISLILLTLLKAVISTAKVNSSLVYSQAVPDMVDRDAISWGSSAAIQCSPDLSDIEQVVGSSYEHHRPELAPLANCSRLWLEASSSRRVLTGENK